MNQFTFFKSARWSHVPAKDLAGALKNLEKAQAIGYNCEACGKVLIERIWIVNGHRYHESCYLAPKPD